MNNPNLQQTQQSHIQPISPHTAQPQQQQQMQNPQMPVRPQQQQQQITKDNIHEFIKSFEQKLSSLGPPPYNHQQQALIDKYNEILTKLRAQEQMYQQNQMKIMQQQQQAQQMPIQMQQHHFQQPQQQVIHTQTQQHHFIQSQQQQQPQPATQQVIQITQHQQPSQQQPAQAQQNVFQSVQQHHPQPQPLQQQSQQQQQQQQLQTQSQLNAQSSFVLEKSSLQSLVKEVDPTEQLDEDVEDILLQIADDFIENVINGSCQIAKHRKSNILEIKDVQFHLERNWNLWVPGFGSEELKPFKKSYSTEAHKQRLALIKKSTKVTENKDKNKE